MRVDERAENGHSTGAQTRAQNCNVVWKGGSMPEEGVVVEDTQAQHEVQRGRARHVLRMEGQGLQGSPRMAAGVLEMAAGLFKAAAAAAAAAMCACRT